MTEWKEVNLSDVCEIVPGFAFKSEHFNDSGDVKVIKIKDISGLCIDTSSATKVFLAPYASKKLEKYKMTKGDFAIAMTGATIGKIGKLAENVEALINQRVAKFNPLAGTNKKFIYFAIISPEFQGFIKRNIDSNSAQENISAGSIGRYPILLPPLSAQQAIADVLSALDDKIELNRQMNETLEATARALFKSWFVDFDPVRAKMEGRAPDGISADIAVLFPENLVDSPLGEIPKGWEEKPMDQMIELIGGGTPKTSNPEYWDGDIPWFSVADTPSDTDVFVLDTEKHISKLGAENSSTKILPVGTTIVTARGTVGKLALVGAHMAMNQSCYGIRGINGDTYWTYFLCRRAVGDLQQRTHGSVFDTITRSTFSSIQVVSPSVAAIEAFDKTVAPILNKIRTNLINNKALVALRDALLPKLISGELRVGDAGTLKEAV